RDWSSDVCSSDLLTDTLPSLSAWFWHCSYFYRFGSPLASVGVNIHNCLRLAHSKLVSCTSFFIMLFSISRCPRFYYLPFSPHFMSPYSLTGSFSAVDYHCAGG